DPSLGLSRSHLHQGPVPKHVALELRANPPHCEGNQSDSALWVKALDPLHQSQRSLLNEVAHWKSRRAVGARDLNGEAKIGRHQSLPGSMIAGSVASTQLAFL